MLGSVTISNSLIAMHKNYSAKQALILPDPVYNSRLVTLFIIKILQSGKKSLAQRIIYNSLYLISTKVTQNPVLVVEKAIKNVTPQFEVKSRRVGGSNFQVPVEVGVFQGTTLGIKWIIQSARARSGKTISQRIAQEILDAAKDTGAAVRKKEQNHKMAEANKAFAYYRY